MEDNEDSICALMEKDYEYTCTFEGGNTEDFSSIFLRFEGLDTVADVYLNGELLGQPLNMHRVWNMKCSHFLKKGRIL